jgi:TPR repeat protein
MVRRLFATLPVFLVVFIGISAAQFFHEQGKSSGDMKNALLNSFLFKATDVFYPLGTRQASDFPQISESGLNFLQTGLQETLKSVVDLHARNADAIAQLVNRRVPATVQAAVVIDNLNQPIAQGVVNEKGILEIRIDVHVLQATFRGSLLAASKDSRILSLDSTPEEKKSDDQLIVDFLEFKQQVAQAKAGSVFGDTFHGDHDRWSKMVDLADQSNDVQMTYVGTLMFIMAHELGHFALGHHHHDCDPSHCERFSQDELEADHYAGYLLGALVAPKSSVFEMTLPVFSQLLDPSHQEKLTGFGTFFNDSYTRVGFVDPGKSLCNCPYPDPKLRGTIAQSGQKEALVRYDELLKTDPALAQKTTPMKVIVPKITGSVEDVPPPPAAQKAAASWQQAKQLVRAQKYADALPLVSDAANSANSEAMFYLGAFYEKGWAVSQDYAEAHKWYEKSASLGNNDAMKNLGLLYYQGMGVPKDYQQGKQWLQKAIDAGNFVAMGAMGSVYEQGLGVDQDYRQAKVWFEKAAAAGESLAMVQLANLYQRGAGVDRNDQQALAWYSKAAAAGYPPAMAQLGEMYYEGDGVLQDFRQAQEWFEKGAAAGDAASMRALGIIYMRGEGVSKDPRKAREWLEQAADAGDIPALGKLAMMYSYGEGGAADYKRARELAEKGVAADDPDSMLMLGELYRKGEAVTQDFQQARKLYERAAASGSAAAMYLLGLMYEEGDGVSRDLTTSRQWYEKSANAGNADAKERLANWDKQSQP